MTDDKLAGRLADLCRRHLKSQPEDPYIREHFDGAFLDGSVRVFRFYEPYLPAEGRVLDWGCRHAPDSCMMRAAGGNLALDGCDFTAPAQYAEFYETAGLRYTQLFDSVQLPYDEGVFDAVVAAGVLEHVPMDYESLKELNRVLKPGGRLIVTYLPNRWSLEEWRSRAIRGAGFHLRRYGLRQVRAFLLHTGFWPIAAGYQSYADLIRPEGAAQRMLRPALRLVSMQRVTACLCAIGEKRVSF